MSYTKNQIEGFIRYKNEIKETAKAPDDLYLLGVYDVEMAAKRVLNEREGLFVEKLASGLNYAEISHDLAFKSFKTFYNWKEEIIEKLHNQLN